MAEQTKMPAPRHTLMELLDNPRIKAAFSDVVRKDVMTPEKMLRLCVNAVRRTPKLLECDPQSVLGAMLFAAAVNLEPNTPSQEAFLIPFKMKKWNPDTKRNDEWTECQFQIGYRGFLAMAWRAPQLREVSSECVYSGDVFERSLGSEAHFKWVQGRGDRGAFQGAFTFTKIEGIGGSGEMSTYMSKEDIEKIRSRSQTYNSLNRRLGEATEKQKFYAQRAFDEQPWVLWHDEMAKKSTIKRHFKTFKIAPTLRAAADVDSKADAQTLDLTAMADPDFLKTVIEGEVEAPEKSATKEPSVEVAKTPPKQEAKAEQKPAAPMPAPRSPDDDPPPPDDEDTGPPPEEDDMVGSLFKR